MIAKRFFIISALLCVLSASALNAQSVQKLSSPDGNIRVEVTLAGGVSYDVWCGDELVLDDCRLALDVKGNVLGSSPKLQKAVRRTVNEVKKPFLHLKYAEVPNHFNELVLKMKGNWAVAFRAYDDGIAYRFETSFADDIEVNHEDISVFFPEEAKLVLQQSGSFRTAYEERYGHHTTRSWKSHDHMAHYPILAVTSGGTKILMSESDLVDYPAPFFRSNDADGFSAVFARVPAETRPRGDKSEDILLRKPYIAKTAGSRTFPWRYFVITKDEAGLVETTMTCRLAQDSKIEDESWIVPGQASWEWWNEAIPYGDDVDFRAGLNVETYKYFMDFASKYGVKYIVMDEGWAKDNMDPYTPNPNCNLFEIIEHGKKVGVDVILWLTWRCVDQNPGLFEKFAEWGVKGVKIDFMDRSDQWMVNFYERTVKEAAKHKIFVNYHGAYKPAGLEYMYPNLLSYEGVLGLEQMGGCNPGNSIYLPFIRNAVGPMEYTPGAMISMQPDRYSANRPNSAGVGTRAYQMALFVVFESGLQMLADNPTLYYRNDDCTRFISSVPVLWDDTKVLEAKLGDYLVVAKRTGEEWFIGGMTAERREPLELEIALDFLPEGKTFTLTSYEDGVNADRQAMHYVKNVREVRKGDVVKIKMVRNGGYAANLK
ncbi:MAG: glycoside hydrolase family 97 protein [Bacteroidales bacterium]|nr:glycoside hydrolase family 97 protein [Bacteroidales bacterium]